MKQVVANYTATTTGDNCCMKCNSSIKLKQRLKEKGSELVTNCHQLKISAVDGKNYLTDVADTEILMVEQPVGISDRLAWKAATKSVECVKTLTDTAKEGDGG